MAETSTPGQPVPIWLADSGAVSDTPADPITMVLAPVWTAGVVFLVAQSTCGTLLIIIHAFGNWYAEGAWQRDWDRINNIR